MNILEQRIDKAQIGEKIDLSEITTPFKSVEFTIEPDKEYCYNLIHKGFGSTTFPMRSQNYVKTFKTLAGCKRNFLRQYSKFYIGV